MRITYTTLDTLAQFDSRAAQAREEFVSLITPENGMELSCFYDGKDDTFELCFLIDDNSKHLWDIS